VLNPLHRYATRQFACCEGEVFDVDEAVVVRDSGTFAILEAR